MNTPLQAQPPLQAQRPPTGTAADSATAANGGTATDSATATSGAAAADTGMSAPAADTGMSAPAATAAAAAMTAPAAAAAAATCNSYALAKRGIFPIEDLKGRQTDVRDFLLGQNKSPCIVLRRYIRCGCGCRCSARHRQRNPGCAQCQGCLSALPYGTSPRLRHGRPSASAFHQGTRISCSALRHEPARCRFGSALCTTLERFRLTCQPPIFAGRHLTLD